MNKLHAWYSGLQEREQRTVAVGGVTVAVAILVFAILMPLHAAVSNAVHGNETRREDLKWMQVNASEVRAAANQLPANTGEAPVVLVDRVAREHGLAASLRGTQPNGSGVHVQLEAAPFDTMVAWLAALDERYGLAIESITLDRTPKPGLVNASVTFTPPRR
jgi:general secretion pathway protein M